MALIAIVGSSILIFFIMRVIPGDPITALLAQAELGLTNEERDAMRAQFGLDLPIYQQYLKWVWDVLRLDPGISLVRQNPVLENFGRAFPVTAELTIISLIFVVSLFTAAGRHYRGPPGYVAGLRGPGYGHRGSGHTGVLDRHNGNPGVAVLV